MTLRMGTELANSYGASAVRTPGTGAGRPRRKGLHPGEATSSATPFLLGYFSRVASELTPSMVELAPL